MKTLLLLCSTVVLVGCGAFGDMDVSYHWDVPLEQIRNMSGDPRGLAYTEWETTPFEKTCDIYMPPLEEVPSNECYDALILHEERHCDEGHFHEPGKGYVPECAI